MKKSDTEKRLREKLNKVAKWGERAREARHARPKTGDHETYDRDTARLQLFALGGMESDIGTRDDIDWYRRRALLTALDMLHQVCDFAGDLGTQLHESLERERRLREALGDYARLARHMVQDARGYKRRLRLLERKYTEVLTAALAETQPTDRGPAEKDCPPSRQVPFDRNATEEQESGVTARRDGHQPTDMTAAGLRTGKTLATARMFGIDLDPPDPTDMEDGGFNGARVTTGRKGTLDAKAPGWPPSSTQPTDPLHPNGRCECGGEGRCAWCEKTEKSLAEPAQPTPTAAPEPWPGLREGLRMGNAWRHDTAHGVCHGCDTALYSRKPYAVDENLYTYCRTCATEPEAPQDTVRGVYGHCADCGSGLNEGEAKTFTVCDACWDKAYPKEPEAPPDDMPSAEAMMMASRVLYRTSQPTDAGMAPSAPVPELCAVAAWLERMANKQEKPEGVG